jgi:uncharacterized repeat protein (TIGR03803 family)
MSKGISLFSRWRNRTSQASRKSAGARQAIRAATSHCGIEPLESRRMMSGTPTYLYSFTGSADDGTDGANPNGGLVMDRQGNLFGLTSYYGASHSGTLYELVNDGGGSYSFRTLYQFAASGTGNDGVVPEGRLVLDSTGNLYGTANQGGANGYGTIWEMTRSDINSDTSAITALYDFGSATHLADGTYPAYGLAIDCSTGTLYGTTTAGGNNYSDFAGGDGVVFKYVPSTNTYTVLHAFNHDAGIGPSYDNGWAPSSTVTIDPLNGDLFCTTTNSSTVSGYGELYEISPSGSTCAGIFNFGDTTTQNSGYHHGFSPLGNLSVDSAGNIYGTTEDGGASFVNLTTGNNGTLYEVSSSGFATLASFNGTNGATPVGGVAIDSAGDIFGTTIHGGSDTAGNVFEYSGGTVTNVYEFTDTSGAPETPLNDLVLDSAGNIYGTTQFGSASPLTYGDGTVYEIGSAATMYHLAFTTQPSNTPQTEPISPAVKVSIEDQTDTVVTSLSDSITVAIHHDTNGATLSGTTTEAASSGVATFSNLSIDKQGTYTLSANDPGVFGAISGSFTIGLPAWLSSGSTASWNYATQTLTVTGSATIIADPQDYGDSPNITVGSGESLTINPTSDTTIHLASLTLSNGGTASVSTTTSSDTLTIYVGTLSVDVTNSSKFDLNNSQMYIDYGSPSSDPISTILTDLTSGYASGAWNGSGIDSSAAASNANVSTALGYIDSADGTGFNTHSNTIFVKYTFYGDVNLDGTVGLTDLAQVEKCYGDSPASWDQGNFYYGSSVGLSDLAVLLKNYGNSI